jgi:3-oxoacyl-[acyl-carrier-protein] synthase II
MRKKVVVTGLGCITPLGNNPDVLWQNIIAGKSGVTPISVFDASEYKTRIAAEVKDFDGFALLGRDTRRMDRFSQFAVVASQQAVQNANLSISDANRDRIGAIIGTGIGGVNTLFEQFIVLIERGPSRVSPFLVPMMLPDSAGANVAINLGIRGPNMAVTSACATGTNTIGEAVEKIRNNKADVMLAGGAEAGISPLALAGMSNVNALSCNNLNPQGASRPFDRNRDGFVMGEGAGILVLESLEFAEGRGANILAYIDGYGVTNDAFHISAPAEDGEGAVRCMRIALNDAGLYPQDIHYINAHGTSTVLNDKTETMAIKTVFGEYAYVLPISSTKSEIGHLLGASGAVEAVICVKVFEQNILPPTINYETPDPNCDLDYIPNQARKVQKVDHIMSNSFGFGGHNATIIFSRYTKEEATK